MDCLKQSILDDSSEEELNKQQPVELQSVIKKANGQGRYQFISFMIFGFMWFVTAWLLLGQSFFFDNEYKCKDQPDKKKCQQLVCNANEDDRENIILSHADSIVFAFSQYLICDYAYIISVLQSILFIGSLSGFFAIPYMADNWGRRIAVRIAWGICTLGVFAICFADSPNMVGIGYFLSGFGCNPAITLTLSIINQETLGKSRQLYGVGVQVFFALGQGVIGFVFLSNLHWYQIGYVMAGLCVLLNILILYIVQSPKFLIKYNKDGAYMAMNQIAKKNGRKLIKKQYFDRVQSRAENAQDNGASIVDLFRYGSLRIITIATGFVFLAVQFIYYYVSLNLGAVGDSKAINQLIVSLSQAAGYIISEFLISCIKRKSFSFIGMLISSVMCFAVGILTMLDNHDNHDSIIYAETASLLINRFVLSAAWAIFYIYVAELYPTCVRSLGFGWVSAMGTVGSAIAPFAILTAQKIQINTWLIPGVIGLIGTAAVIFCPQTFGKPLKDQIQQKLHAQHDDKAQQQQDIFGFRKNQPKTEYIKHEDTSAYIPNIPTRSLQINNTPPASPYLGSQNAKNSQGKSNNYEIET